MRKFLLAACLFAIASAQSLGCGGGTTQPPQGATALPDADGDGIPDTWEQKGVDYKWAPDGSAHHVDMHQLGASTTHKDIFVWVA